MLTEAAAVLPGGRISPDDLGPWKDEYEELLWRTNWFVVSPRLSYFFEKSFPRQSP